MFTAEEIRRNNDDAYYALRDRMDEEEREEEREKAERRARKRRSQQAQENKPIKSTRAGDEGFSELFSFLGFCIVGAIAVTKLGAWGFALSETREIALFVASFFAFAFYAARYTYRATMAFNLLMALSLIGGLIYLAVRFGPQLKFW